MELPNLSEEEPGPSPGEWRPVPLLRPDLATASSIGPSSWPAGRASEALSWERWERHAAWPFFRDRSQLHCFPEGDWTEVGGYGIPGMECALSPDLGLGG